MLAISSIQRSVAIAKQIKASHIVSIVDPSDELPDFGSHVDHIVRRAVDTEVQTDMFAPRQ